MKAVKFYTVFVFFMVMIMTKSSVAQNIVAHTDQLISISGIESFIDTANTLSINDIRYRQFTVNKDKNLNFGITNSSVWLKFNVTNQLKEMDWIFLHFDQALLDSITVFIWNGTSYDSTALGKYKKFNERNVKSLAYIVPVKIKNNATVEVIAKVHSFNPMYLPVTAGASYAVFADEQKNTLTFGLYTGIIFIMIFYNLFVFVSVKDDSYLYYILFITFVWMSQAVLRGFGFKYLWPNSPWFEINSSIIIPFLSGITTALFMKRFLQTKTQPVWINHGINIFMLSYLVSLIAGLLFSKILGVQLLQFTAFWGAIFALLVAYKLTAQGFRPALFFLIAYFIFLIAVIIFVLRNFHVLEYNWVTNYILEIGSAIQITLLSFALADKINTYRRAQDIARREALNVSLENQRLIKEQNILLEKEVKSRTLELTKTNSDLVDAMDRLKQTQAKLVETEKMASLGQLTAGIAHEINNPINFVTSNVRPLEMNITDLSKIIDMYSRVDYSKDIEAQVKDIEAFKEEIEFDYVKEEIGLLLNGIKEGAGRTSEIVKGLRSFARVDEASWKKADINEGIESTLLLVKNTFPDNFELIKELGPLPRIECAISSINQVFMNIITNAIHAIKERQKKEPLKGVLEIITDATESRVRIVIKDNGSGIPPEVKSKIFDPFFTTKDVGEGSGLGLSIVQGIIQKHNGDIQVDSDPGAGTIFTIHLPIR